MGFQPATQATQPNIKLDDGLSAFKEATQYAITKLDSHLKLERLSLQEVAFPGPEALAARGVISVTKPLVEKDQRDKEKEKERQDQQIEPSNDKEHALQKTSGSVVSSDAGGRGHGQGITGKANAFDAIMDRLDKGSLSADDVAQLESLTAKGLGKLPPDTSAKILSAIQESRDGDSLVQKKESKPSFSDTAMANDSKGSFRLT